MNLDDIKENLREQFVQLAGSVKESSAFIQASERYQNLSPNGQKVALYGGAAVLVLLLLLIPWTFYSGSMDKISDYEDRRDNIRKLFQVSREASALPMEPPEITSSDLQNRVRNELQAAQLQPEQIGMINGIEGKTVKDVPASVSQAGVTVPVNMLNVTQLVDIGHKLQLVHPTAKMVGIDIKASAKDSHLFDVTYKIVAFSVPKAPAPKASAKGAKGSAKPPPTGSEER